MIKKNPLDDILEGVELPSEEEIKKETADWNKSQANKRKAKDPAWLAATTAASQRKAKDPNWIASMKQSREEFYADPERVAAYKEKLAAAYTPERAEKQRLQNKEIPLFQKGHKKDIQHKLNSAKGSMRCNVMTPHGEFESYLDFEMNTDKTVTYIRDKMRLLPHLYYLVDDGPGEAITETVWYTPYGCAPHNMKRWMCRKEGTENFKQWFDKRSKEDPGNFYTKVEPKRDWDRKND